MRGWMMKDIDKLKQIFDEFGIKYDATIPKKTGINADWLQYVEIPQERFDSKNRGYIGFFTQFVFDENGKFIEVGAYE
jgi:hypothetical protein